MIPERDQNSNTDIAADVLGAGILGSLEERVALLIARVERLERLLDATGDLPEECRDHTCDYYVHYLSAGPADMPHAAYHVAVEEHAGVCDEIDMYLDRSMAVPRALEAQAERLERKVRA